MYDENSQEDVSKGGSVDSEKDESDDESMSDESQKNLSDNEDKEETAGLKKNQSINIVDIDDQDYDDHPIRKKLNPSISKRLKNGKGKRKVATPTFKASNKSTFVGPAKGYSKVATPTTKKSKEVTSSEFEHDFKQNIRDIMPSTMKKFVGKKIPANVPEVPIDNITFHSIENVENGNICTKVE